MSNPPCDTHHLCQHRVTYSHGVQTCAIAHQGWSSFGNLRIAWRPPSASYGKHLTSPRMIWHNTYNSVTAGPTVADGWLRRYSWMRPTIFSTNKHAPQRSYCIVSVPSQLLMSSWMHAIVCGLPTLYVGIPPCFHVCQAHGWSQKIQSGNKFAHHLTLTGMEENPIMRWSIIREDLASGLRERRSWWTGRARGMRRTPGWQWTRVNAPVIDFTFYRTHLVHSSHLGDSLCHMTLCA